MEYKVEIVCKRNDEIIGRVKRAKIGWSVYDSKKRKIGRVSDIFGPANNPYIRIKKLKKSTGEITVGGDDKWQKRKKRRNG